MADLEALRGEIERLSRELDQASSEKIQSAQYGLVLLEEKSHLKTRCEDLETLYENTRHELDITLEVRGERGRALNANLLCVDLVALVCPAQPPIAVFKSVHQVRRRELATLYNSCALELSSNSPAAFVFD